MFDDVDYSGCDVTSSDGVVGDGCSVASSAVMFGFAVNASEEVQLRLLSIGERMCQHAAEVGARFDFTPQQVLLIFRLGEPQTMGQLADSLSCDRSNITGLSSRLEASGLVERVADVNDRHSKWLTLTAEGESLREAFRKDIFRGTDMLSGPDETESQTLLELLRRVSLNLDAGDGC